MKFIIIPITIAFCSTFAYGQRVELPLTPIQQSTNAEGLNLFSPKIDDKGRLVNIAINGRRFSLVYTDDFSKKPYAMEIDGVIHVMHRTGKIYSRDEIDAILDKHGTSVEALANPENLEKVKADVMTGRAAGCNFMPERRGPNSATASVEEIRGNSPVARPSDCGNDDIDGNDYDGGGGYYGGGNSGGGNYAGTVPGFGDSGEMEDGDFWDSYFGNVYGLGSQTWGIYAAPVCRIETGYCMQSCSNWATAAYGICAVGAASLGFLNPIAGGVAGVACITIAYQKSQACYADCQLNVVCH